MDNAEQVIREWFQDHTSNRNKRLTDAVGNACTYLGPRLAADLKLQIPEPGPRDAIRVYQAVDPTVPNAVAAMLGIRGVQNALIPEYHAAWSSLINQAKAGKRSHIVLCWNLTDKTTPYGATELALEMVVGCRDQVLALQGGA